MTRILVIRLGALGDLVLSFAPFAAIRAAHPAAEITLLTTPPFAALGQAAPWFDRVAIDPRAPWWNLAALLRLRRHLRGFDFVYDLQTSRRSSRYFALAGRPPWSGIAAGCSHPHANPARNFLHSIERQREQLEMAGIRDFPQPDLGWLTRLPVPNLPARFALLVPGTSARGAAKRWPSAAFAGLAGVLAGRGLAPVVAGTRAEAAMAAEILAACPGAIDLTGRTDIATLAAIAARASLAVGGDTGPIHLACAVGAPTLALFSAASDPALAAPRRLDGGTAAVLRASRLADLPMERVAQAALALAGL